MPIVRRTDEEVILGDHERRLAALERAPGPSSSGGSEFWQGAYWGETTDRLGSGMTQVGFAIGSPGGVGYWGIQKKAKKNQIFNGMLLFLTQLPVGTPPANMQLVVLDSSMIVRAVSGDITGILATGPVGYVNVPFFDDEPLPQDDWLYAAMCSTDDWTGPGSRAPGVQASIPSIGGSTTTHIFNPIDRGYTFGTFGSTPGQLIVEDFVGPGTPNSNVPWLALY